MSLEERFGTAKPVIAMVHFPGLPGRPRHDRGAGRSRLLDVVGRDLEVLQDAGVDAVLFCNEADIPYQLTVGPEIPAAMAAVIGELHPSIRVPFGVNVLWDPRASLAVARATGAVFIREVLTGVYESDMGLIAPSLGDLASYREAIGASDVALFGNITPEFSSTLGTRTVAERARSASFLGLDVILISGPEAGVPFAMSDLRAAKQAAPQTPVLANTGVTADRLAETLAVADGVIVGTSLKVDGITWNPVDPARVRQLRLVQPQLPILFLHLQHLLLLRLDLIPDLDRSEVLPHIHHHHQEQHAHHRGKRAHLAPLLRIICLHDAAVVDVLGKEHLRRRAAPRTPLRLKQFAVPRPHRLPTTLRLYSRAHHLHLLSSHRRSCHRTPHFLLPAQQFNLDETLWFSLQNTNRAGIAIGGRDLYCRVVFRLKEGGTTPARSLCCHISLKINEICNQTWC